MRTQHIMNDLRELPGTPFIDNPDELERVLAQSVLGQGRTTLFGWLMFGITLRHGAPEFDFAFHAPRAFTNELALIQILQRHGVSFSYIKAVPDDIPQLFWGQDCHDGALSFASDASYFFRDYPTPVSVTLFSELLVHSGCQAYYSNILNTVHEQLLSSRAETLLPYAVLSAEAERRASRYGVQTHGDDSPSQSVTPPLIGLARLAFSLFSAEANTLYRLSWTNTLPGIVLVAGQGSTGDIEKYEFHKDPAGRPVLPKLFVL